MQDQNMKNLAETLADVLPKAALIDIQVNNLPPGYAIGHVAVPKGHEVKRFDVDLEKFQPNPRRTEANALFSDADSFLRYVKRHAFTHTVVWCSFNPQTFELVFRAVFDEHAKDLAGWRKHTATFAPDMSADWKAWTAQNAKPFGQVEFATWIQDHEQDITAANGLPTSLQMLEMATNFQMNEDRVLKSAVKLQSGGVRLTYIADQDQGTEQAMQLFERFAIGIPVFQGVPAAWSITARLRYRNERGVVKFHYELQRHDRVHEAAATELITSIRDSLGDTPMLMGSCG